MTQRSRIRPAHWVVLVLTLAPAWKAAEWAMRPGPKAVSLQAVAAGRALFVHEWTPKDPLTSGDGLGPVFNARSCVECHSQASPGGGGPVSKNVTVYGLIGDARGMPLSGVVHQKAVRPEFQETLNLLRPGLPHAPSIPLAQLVDRTVPKPTDVVITQRNTPALFGDGLIDAVPDETLIAHQREHSTAARLVGLNGAKDGKVRGRIARLADGRVGRFGWKLEFATLNDFVKAACANELGLSNPGRPQATPLGKPKHPQPDTPDLTDAQCVLMTDFIRGLPAPTQEMPSDPRAAERVKHGRTVFNQIGCADCHSESLATVSGLYSDMLLHDMGVELQSSTGYYGSIIPQPVVANDKFAVSEQPTPGEWRTAPLWGVADSGPYLHDGRAGTLEEAIELHGGEAGDVAIRFKGRPKDDRDAVIAFLKTLRAPQPTDAVAAH
ncbi:MAG: thiol oxidoreductase [Planctomycetia bacterium]|nr:thiol oxidoreductase [Planctomycetia bacterium]